MRPFHLAAWLVCSVAVFMAKTAFAEGYNVGDACAAAGTLHTKNDTLGTYHLVCNGTTWVLSTTFEKTGNVGIGTAIPAYTLDIVRPQIYNQNSVYARFGQGPNGDGTENRFMTFGNTNGGSTRYIQSDSDDTNSRNLAINPLGGNVGIGTGVTTGKLTISHLKADGAAVATDGLYFQRADTAAWGAIYAQGSSGFNGSLIFATDGDGGQNFNITEKMRIDYAGNVGIGTTSPAVKLDVVGDIQYTGVIADVSDRRLKENIQALQEGQLESIIALQPVSFTMKGDDETELGLIAQDVEQLYPELVKTMPNGNKSLNYTGLIGPMIEAIKEQQEQIEKLEARLAAIDGGCRPTQKPHKPVQTFYNP